MIRQRAFDKRHGMLKGGLHCHTTRSDGAHTPEEVIAYCHDRGYDFLALTDHRIYNLEHFAPDIPLTVIPGMEHDNLIEEDRGFFRCYHTLCLGPVEGNGFRQDETMPTTFARSAAEYQPVLDEIHAKGNITVYCHPEWSSTPARLFEDLRGNFAMEIWNSISAIHSGMDMHAAYWDELLGAGQKIYGVATDDAHDFDACCRGWVMVNSENSVPAILEALEEGAFYSSCGPEIYDFYIDGGKAVVSCSGARTVRFCCDGHPSLLKASEGGPIHHCEMPLRNLDGFLYLRAEVADARGRVAWTNPIFLR